MHITSRAKTIAFFITLGICLVALAVALNVSWIVLNWRQMFLLVFGIVVFTMIIAGLVVNTIFLVREIRRSDRQDSFLNAVTHELKTPIASIRLYLETLRTRPLDELQRQTFYRVMLEDVDRLLGTVDQVLKAGEVRYGRRRRNLNEVDLSAIVRNTLDLARLRHHLTPEQLRFGSAPAEGLLVMGNAEEFRAAIFNLFDNAIKYSGDKKDIVVDVETPTLDHILVNVRDRGIGIPKVELKRIFKRFYRVQNDATGQVKGTGLGLFIVRSVARRYGGDAYAESEGEGRGSTFTIRLPRTYRA
jgi:signal transduction histidine kinase